jgi:hypothetical protein
MPDDLGAYAEMLAVAEARVTAGEARVERLRQILDELERDNHPAALERGRTALRAVEASVELARHQLEDLRLNPPQKHQR